MISRSLVGPALFLSLCRFVAAGSAAWGADAKTPANLVFPSDWIGASCKVESLKGKAVLLYFFEEQCPKCRGAWPRVIETAKKHQDEPIVFIAVNSGNPKSAVESYARAVKLNWPIIVDSDRSFEASCGVGTISLNNIMQFAYVTASGKLKRGDWSDLDGTIQKALVGAAWNVDPANIPEELKPAWRSIEFGQFSKAAPVLIKAVKSAKPEVKEAAKKLGSGVNTKIKAELSAASILASASKWEAFKRYSEIAQQYAGFPAATEAMTHKTELAKDPEVKSEVAALKVLEANRSLITSPKETVRNRAVTNMKKLIDEHPDSEAAKVAALIVSGR